jgi:hypothetical protein
MTKIKNTVAYKIKSPLSLTDYAIGTNNESGIPGFAKGQSISIGLNEMRELFLAGLSPELGGTFKITEIVPVTASTSIADVANAMSPAYVVQRYELVAINLNGVVYVLKQQNITFGIGQDALTSSDFIKFTSIVNKGTGQTMVSYNSTLKQYEVLTIDSDTLTKTVDADGLTLNIPSTSSIPALYVNNLYIPTQEEFLAGNTKGFGTLAKPFTDTITAYVSGVPTITPNTAIENAKVAFVGTGSRLNPQLSGQKIIVQDNNSAYIDAGDFNYSNLDIEFNALVLMTNSQYILDIDNGTNFNQTSAVVKIKVNEGYKIIVTQSLGFKNSGNTTNTDTFTNSKTIFLLGDGEITFSYNGANVLTQYILNGDGNNNDGNIHFIVNCILQADFQGVYNCTNKTRIDFYNRIQSGFFLGSVNVALQAFRQTGGQIRFYERGSITIDSAVSGRTYGITFEPIGAGIGFCLMTINNTTINYNCNFTFARLNNQIVDLSVRNVVGGGGNTLPGSPTVVAGLFENLGASKWTPEFKNNNFKFTGINNSKVDLTRGNTTSVINFIGDNVIENLVVFASRFLAVSNGISIGSAFINRKTITAGSFVAGTEYQILTVGTTDFTLIGASANTVGFNFTATNVGSGTGTAYSHTRDTLI